MLHTGVGVGDVLSISVPFGALVLDDYSGRPMMFISAGIGITPMAGMLSHLATAGSHLPIMLLHADHNENAFALRGQIREDIAALPTASLYVWYEQGDESQLPMQGVFAGRMDLSHVRLPDNASYHLCGPVPFMHGIRSALIELGIPPQDIQYEVFGPDLWQADFE